MENKLKKIKDLSYAAVLRTKNFKLVDISWEGGIGWFVFEIDDSAEQILKAFINGDLIGNLKKYDEATRTLRQMLFSSKK